MSAAEPVAVRRALLSVYDKEGLVELARGLVDLGVEILTTGGTARMLIEHGVPVVRVADYTQFPEMLDGRVKTLHPKIHAGIMSVRTNPVHAAQMERAGIPPIDLVVVNLYPFEKTAAMEGIGFDEVVEMIDIGGPTLVRGAAKNFRHVGVVVDPADYGEVLAALRERGEIPESRRFDLARKAFRHVAAYDTAIYAHLEQVDETGALVPQGRASHFPPRLTLEFTKGRDLRYGENPHQKAALYLEMAGNAPSVSTAEQLAGKELSFNNILDLDAALRCASDFAQPVCVAIKHGNPCGVGGGAGPREAFEAAREADPVSIFGGILGWNVEVDGPAAEAVGSLFLEAIIAPGYTTDALRLLGAKKGLRLLRTGAPLSGPPQGLDLRRVTGGLLLQEWDRPQSGVDEGRVVTQRAPDRGEREAMRFAWTVARHVRSNAVVYATKRRTLGIGAGQMSRVDSVRFGAQKATGPLQGCALASDGFFPFRDGVDEAAAAGVRAIVQPGGSVRDNEVIAAADEHGIAMILTGSRHFRH